MKSPECASVECIYNDKLHKGICIGVSKNTNSYGRDVVRQCWVKQKPTPNISCVTEMQVQMTPRESVGIGVALIRASAIGEMLLSKIDKELLLNKINKHEEAKQNSNEKENP